MRLVGLAVGLLAVMALASAAAAGAFGGHAYPPQGVPPPPSPAELQKLGRHALSAASQAGDPHPTSAVVVPSTRRIAEQVDAGAGIEANTPVYFVVLHGRFRLTNVSVPPGATAPTETILTQTIDARTNGGLDVGLGDRMPDLYAIGQPEPLPLPASSSRP
jgi:hypothetical protein